MTIHAPETPTEWAAYYALRYAVLRQPWGQPPGSERVPDDDAPTTIHALLAAPDGTARAVGCLHRSGPGQGQVRFMAVAADQQGRGWGSAVLTYLEAQARVTGLAEIVLHSRETAVPFYQRHGYQVVEPSHTLFGQLPHFLMRKLL